MCRGGGEQTHWTERPSMDAGIPSGTITLEKDMLFAADNNSVVVCRARALNGTDVTHNITLSVFGEHHLQQ